MKKLLTVGLLSIAVVALSEQRASAWIKANIGAGVNLSWASGGNNVLWGAFAGLPPKPYGHYAPPPHPGHHPFFYTHFKYPHVPFYAQPKPPKTYYFGPPPAHHPVHYYGGHGGHYPVSFGQ